MIAIVCEPFRWNFSLSAILILLMLIVVHFYDISSLSASLLPSAFVARFKGGVWRGREGKSGFTELPGEHLNRRVELKEYTTINVSEEQSWIHFTVNFTNISSRFQLGLGEISFYFSF